MARVRGPISPISPIVRCIIKCNQSPCAVDKENLHRILLQMLRSRQDSSSSSTDGNCPLLDAAMSLDVSGAVMSADVVSILIAALTTTAPRECHLVL